MQCSITGQKQNQYKQVKKFKIIFKASFIINYI